MRYICLLLVCLLGGFTLKAYDFSQENLYFTVTSAENLTCAVDRGENVYSGEIVIPATVVYKNKQLRVTSITNSAFEGSFITSIRLSDNMTSVERYAFNNCNALVEVVIPPSINIIGEGAFSGCQSLKYLIMEDGESELEFDTYCHDPFFANSPLEELYIGRDIEHFITKYSVFGNLSNLKKVKIGKYVTTIASYFFANAKILDCISIPANVKTIKEAAFNSCFGLKRIEFCDGEDPIKMYHSTIGSPEYSGGTVNYSIFSQSPVEEVYIGRNFSENSYYYYPQDITFEFLPITKVTIGKYVTKLTSLNGCRDLESIYIPSNVKSIESFSGCKGLRTVVVNNITPPSGNRFAEETYVHGTLYVPAEGIPTYSATNPWSCFWAIEDISFAGIDNIISDSISTNSVYSINGVLIKRDCSKDEIKNLPQGIYIWRGQKIFNNR